jgi:hypothetical protein
MTMIKTYGLEIKDVSQKDVARIEQFLSKFVQSHKVIPTYYLDGQRTWD